jgi:IS30 family transposase
MEELLKEELASIIFETCRDQMDEVKTVNGADAGEKMRVCYSKFYKLLKHQNDYYRSLTKNQFEDILNA